MSRHTSNPPYNPPSAEESNLDSTELGVDSAELASDIAEGVSLLSALRGDNVASKKDVRDSSPLDPDLDTAPAAPSKTTTGQESHSAQKKPLNTSEEVRKRRREQAKERYTKRKEVAAAGNPKAQAAIERKLDQVKALRDKQRAMETKLGLTAREYRKLPLEERREYEAEYKAALAAEAASAASAKTTTGQELHLARQKPLNTSEEAERRRLDAKRVRERFAQLRKDAEDGDGEAQEAMERHLEYAKAWRAKQKEAAAAGDEKAQEAMEKHREQVRALGAQRKEAAAAGDEKAQEVMEKHREQKRARRAKQAEAALAGDEKAQEAIERKQEQNRVRYAKQSATAKKFDYLIAEYLKLPLEERHKYEAALATEAASAATPAAAAAPEPAAENPQGGPLKRPRINTAEV